jgi:hypothetical protein
MAFQTLHMPYSPAHPPLILFPGNMRYCMPVQCVEEFKHFDMQHLQGHVLDLIATIDLLND